MQHQIIAVLLSLKIYFEYSSFGKIGTHISSFAISNACVENIDALLEGRAGNGILDTKANIIGTA